MYSLVREEADPDDPDRFVQERSGGYVADKSSEAAAVTTDPVELAALLPLIKSNASTMYSLVREEADPDDPDRFVQDRLGGYVADKSSAPVAASSSLTRALVVKAYKAETLEDVQKIMRVYTKAKEVIAVPDLFRQKNITFFNKTGDVATVSFTLEELTNLLGYPLDSSHDADILQKCVNALTARASPILDGQIAEMDRKIQELSASGHSMTTEIEQVQRLKGLRAELPMIRDEKAARNLLLKLNQRDLHGLASAALSEYLLKTSENGSVNIFGEDVRLVPTGEAEDVININSRGELTSGSIKRPNSSIVMSSEGVSDPINGEIVLLESDLKFNSRGDITRCDVIVEKPTPFIVPLEVHIYIDRDASKLIDSPSSVAALTSAVSSATASMGGAVASGLLSASTVARSFIGSWWSKPTAGAGSAGAGAGSTASSTPSVGSPISEAMSEWVVIKTPEQDKDRYRGSMSSGGSSVTMISGGSRGRDDSSVGVYEEDPLDGVLDMTGDAVGDKSGPSTPVMKPEPKKPVIASDGKNTIPPIVGK